MTEAEWLASVDSKAMQAFLRRKVSDRKQRLFAVACCRVVWSALEEEDRRAVDVAERYADGQATAEERAAAYARAGEGPAASFMAGDSVADYQDSLRIEAMREENAVSGGTFAADSAVYFLADAVKAAGLDSESAHRSACGFLRDIFGNPFRPLPAIDPAWRAQHDETIVKLAERMYDSRDFAGMPVLADALEEAGCTNADILDHCRGPGPHVRGCWVVDLILGKV